MYWNRHKWSFFWGHRCCFPTQHSNILEGFFIYSECDLKIFFNLQINCINLMNCTPSNIFLGQCRFRSSVRRRRLVSYFYSLSVASQVKGASGFFWSLSVSKHHFSNNFYYVFVFQKNLFCGILLKATNQNPEYKILTSNANFLHGNWFEGHKNN